jgi:hypothetical protein
MDRRLYRSEAVEFGIVVVFVERDGGAVCASWCLVLGIGFWDAGSLLL